MKRGIILLLAFSWLGLGRGLLFGQFKPEEIARRPEMEEFLLTAEIVGSEPVGEGVTKPFVLTLKKGDLETKAFWKNPSGVMYGFLEGWQYEIAAYRLDKLIGLNMIPPTVEREFQGKKGALSLWAEHKFSLLKAAEEGLKMPVSAVDRVNKAKWLTRAWDSLIANEDRTQQNVLYTDDMRTILIDHSRSFRSSKKFTERLMFGADGIVKSQEGKPYLFERLPRTVVDNIRALTFESVKAAVGDTLTDKEIRAVLLRRDLLVKEIEENIRAKGEDQVLY